MKSVHNLPERLFIVPAGPASNREASWALRDARGYHLGFFNSAAAAESWCRQNGYRYQVRRAE